MVNSIKRWLVGLAAGLVLYTVQPQNFTFAESLGKPPPQQSAIELAQTYSPPPPEQINETQQPEKPQTNETLIHPPQEQNSPQSTPSQKAPYKEKSLTEKLTTIVESATATIGLQPTSIKEETKIPYKPGTENQLVNYIEDYSLSANGKLELISSTSIRQTQSDTCINEVTEKRDRAQNKNNLVERITTHSWPEGLFYDHFRKLMKQRVIRETDFSDKGVAGETKREFNYEIIKKSGSETVYEIYLTNKEVSNIITNKKKTIQDSGGNNILVNEEYGIENNSSFLKTRTTTINYSAPTGIESETLVESRNSKKEELKIVQRIVNLKEKVAVN